jgi:hypothetical protein
VPGPQNRRYETTTAELRTCHPCGIRFARDTEHPFDLGRVTMTSAWKAPDVYGRQIDRLVQAVRESGVAKV